MIREYYQIKDKCRQGLIKHLEKAFSVIPETENPEILDIGCGTGVPTLWIADKYTGAITAIDTDKNALEWLQNKIIEKDLSDKVTALNISFFDFMPNPDCYDLIIAEGFLNTVGFENGFLRIVGILKKNRHVVIHDEYKDHEKKSGFIRSRNCKIVDTIYLDEKIWWNDYYRLLESEIMAIDSKQTRDLFKSDLEEVKCYRADPGSFRSIYYLVEKL